jgi:hypothetical protein
MLRNAHLSEDVLRREPLGLARSNDSRAGRVFVDYDAGSDQLSVADYSKEWAYPPPQSDQIPPERPISAGVQISPPLTPRHCKEGLSQDDSTHFHNYLRAFYHFHPTSTVSSTGDESSITVPISQGDVILVHSIQENGWADGTLLGSGARGWLPTNYCEPFDPTEIRSLLTSLTNLWDLVRCTEHETLSVFARQDYVRGMIAGVRIFLVRLPPAPGFI